MLDQRGNIPGPQLQLFGKVAAPIVDKVEPAEVLAYKTDGQLFFSMYGSSVCSDAAGDVLGVQQLAVGQVAVLAVHRDIAVKGDAVQRVQVRQMYRRAAGSNKRFDAVLRSRASASTVEAGRCLASKGSSVPSMSKMQL